MIKKVLFSWFMAYNTEKADFVLIDKMEEM
jgi:hypothetical protein